MRSGDDRGEGGDLVAVGDVERVAGEAQAARCEFGGERIEGRRADIGEREMATARSEPDSECAADAAAGAGDHRGLAAQVEAVHQFAAFLRRKCRAGSARRLYRVTMRSLK